MTVSVSIFYGQVTVSWSIFCGQMAVSGSIFCDQVAVSVCIFLELVAVPGSIYRRQGTASVSILNGNDGYLTYTVPGSVFSCLTGV